MLLFVGGVLYGFVRRAAGARRSASDAGLVVASGGMFLVWLIHTSVDWIHLLPGVTGAALAAAAVLLAPWRRTGADGARRGSAHKIVIAGCGALVIAAAVFLGRATLADSHATDAKALATSDPRQAIREADHSLALNGDSVPTYYTRAAAYARLDDYAERADRCSRRYASSRTTSSLWRCSGTSRRDAATVRRPHATTGRRSG